MVISREQDTKHTYEHGNKCVWVWKKYIYLFCLFIYFLHFFFLFLVLIFFVNSPAKSTNSNIIKYSFFEFAAVRALESSVWLTESVDLACIVVSTLCLCLSVVSVFVSCLSPCPCFFTFNVCVCVCAGVGIYINQWALSSHICPCWLHGQTCDDSYCCTFAKMCLFTEVVCKCTTSTCCVAAQCFVVHNP